MSRRRKNAGEGYGYMFHGAFAKKADAVAKEKKTKGAWVKGTPTNRGYRYLVMSPRTNPRKTRKKMVCGVQFAHGMGGDHWCTLPKGHKGPHRQDRKNSVAWGKTQNNPMDLVVMGANPEPQEIVARPGQTITIRVNPSPLAQSSDDSRYMQLAALELYGKALNQLTARELSKVAMRAAQLKRAQNPAAICGARIGRYKCSRKPGHTGPHLPQGATLRPRSRHNWGRSNPSAEAIREDFTGREVDRVSTFREAHMPAGNYALLGKLLALYVKPHAGGQVQMIKATGGTQVVSDESARQIYFVGGDQDISSALSIFGAIDRGAGLFELGEARRIDYKQRKEHVPDPDVDEWRHEFGEESGERPKVLFDVNHKRLLLEGGAYEIRPEGIVN